MVTSMCMLRKSPKFYLILVILLLSSAFFFRLGRADVQGDSATYLFRSLGYVDYMSSKVQTTPLQWSAQLPWWIRIGFHDAPVFSFITNYITLNASQYSVTAARAIPAAYGVTIGVLLWWFVKKRTTDRAGIIFLAIFLSLTPLITIHRTNILESHMLVWLAIGLISFFLTEQHHRYWYLSAVFFGFALLTKYTAAFVLLGPLLYLATQPVLFKNKHVQRSMVLFLIIILPIFIYNIMMYRAVGHPDLQFSILLNSDMKDHWDIITRQISDASVRRDFTPLTRLLFPTVIIVVIASIINTIYGAWKKHDITHITVAGSILGSLIGIIILGADFRFAVGLILCCAFATALMLIDLNKTDALKKYEQKIFWFIAVCVFGGVIATATINYSYREPRGLMKLSGRETNLGWNQLDRVLTAYLNPRTPQVVINAWGFYAEGYALRQEFARIQQPEGVIPYRGYILYDSRTPWFHGLWYFERWNFYRRFAVVSIQDYVGGLEKHPHAYKEAGFVDREVSVIIALNPTNTANEKLNALISDIERTLIEAKTPSKIINDPSGTPQFKLYGPLAQQP